ncbi:MAG: hypothetical protein U9O98_08110 [Asgard group archaeon]|nr:hypothetical protein [Asgard group archaeon]
MLEKILLKKNLIMILLLILICGPQLVYGIVEIYLFPTQIDGYLFLFGSLFTATCLIIYTWKIHSPGGYYRVE